MMYFWHHLWSYALDISTETVKLDRRFAKASLRCQMQPELDDVL